jgi:hypothetical protein
MDGSRIRRRQAGPSLTSLTVTAMLPLETGLWGSPRMTARMMVSARPPQMSASSCDRPTACPPPGTCAVKRGGRLR